MIRVTLAAALCLATVEAQAQPVDPETLPVPRVREIDDRLVALEPIPSLFRCRVTGKAYDGDTFYCLGDPDFKIRTFGADTPELGRYGKPDQPGARAARNALRELTDERTLACEYRDINADRIVARCWRDDGLDLGADMVGRGFATTCPRFAGSLYAELERPGVKRAPFCEARR